MMKMKKVKAFVLVLILTGSGLFAQENANNRYIEVNGVSEIEITPDEIFVVGVLQEEKSDIFDKVERNFLSQLKKSGIASEDIQLADMSGEYASAWFKKDQLIKEKTFQIKLNSSEMVGTFLKIADEVGLKNVRILRTDISKRKEVEQDLRINAVKDAKNKAIYMTKAIESNIGDVLQIRENYLSIYRGNERVNDLAMVQSTFQGKAKVDDGLIVGFKKIRMEMKVMVRFEISN